MTSSHISANPTACDIDTVEELLCHHLKALWSQPETAGIIPPLMLWGPPGIGKSAVMRQVATDLNIGFLDIRLAQREPIDIRGLPVPKEDGVHWLLSSEWPRDPESRGIILFDELTAADRTLQVAAYEFILDRRLGDLYSVPPGWYIAAAGNRSADRAVATTMSSALANRFCHLEVEADLAGWARWATTEGLHPNVIAFLRFRPDCFFNMTGNLERGWPSPRTWERVSMETYLAERTNLSNATLSTLVQGLVGPGAGTEYMAFLDWAKKLPDVDAMLRGKTQVCIPERADQRYALCSAMVHALWAAKNPAGLLTGFFKISVALTSDFAAMTMIDALTGTTEDETVRRSSMIMKHPQFNAWTRKHGPAFSARLKSNPLRKRKAA